MLRLQHLAPDEGQRHTEPPVVAVALEVVGRDGDPGRVEARAREAAGLGEGEEIGAVVAAHAEHDGRLRALDLPVPVLRVDEPPSLRGLRQRDDARARLVAGDSAAKLGVAPELEDLRARVEQRDGLEVEPGALGDAAHFLDVGGLEGVHLRHVLADELADGGGVEARALELLRVVAHAQRDALGGLAAVLPAALARRSLHLDQRKRLGHPHCSFMERSSQKIVSTFIPRVLTYQSRERATFVTGMRRWSNLSMPVPAASAEARHHLAREHLHRAAHVRLRQTAEVHPAEHLTHAQALHLLELRRHGVG